MRAGQIAAENSKELVVVACDLLRAGQDAAGNFKELVN